MSVNKVSQTDGSLAPIAGGTLYADEPIGTILPFGGSAIPNGFLLCNGAAVSRTTYAALFAVIGTSFGSGDGSTTFNIPDLRGEFLRGAGTNSHSGQGDGGTVGQHQNATIIPNSGFATNSNNIRVYGYASTNTVTSLATNFDKVLYPSTTGVETTTSSNLNRFTATNDVASGTVRPTNTSVNYIIKATTIALPSDFEDAVDAKLALKQDKLTDPLTKSDVVNNLTSSSTDLPLSAAMGKSLNTKVGVLGTVYTTNTVATNSAQSASFTLVGMSIANVPAGVYVISSTGRLRDSSTCGGRLFLTLTGASQICLGHGSSTQGPAALPWSVTSVVKLTGTTTIQAIFYFEHSVSANILSQGQLNAVRIA